MLQSSIVQTYSFFWLLDKKLAIACIFLPFFSASQLSQNFVHSAKKILFEIKIKIKRGIKLK